MSTDADDGPLGRSTFRIGRNLLLYLVGVVLAVVGALGIVEAIDLSAALSWSGFVVGLALVLAIHEYFDGPL